MSQLLRPAGRLEAPARSQAAGYSPAVARCRREEPGRSPRKMRCRLAGLRYSRMRAGRQLGRGPKLGLRNDCRRWTGILLRYDRQGTAWIDSLRDRMDALR